MSISSRGQHVCAWLRLAIRLEYYLLRGYRIIEPAAIIALLPPTHYSFTHSTLSSGESPIDPWNIWQRRGGRLFIGLLCTVVVLLWEENCLQCSCGCFVVFYGESREKERVGRKTCEVGQASETVRETEKQIGWTNDAHFIMLNHIKSLLPSLPHH